MTQPPLPSGGVTPPPIQLNYASRGGTATIPVYSDGTRLIAGKGALLPDRCIKCGGPISRPQIRKNLSWVHPICYVGLLGGLLPFLVLALILQKKGVLHIGICERHRRRRIIMIIACWLMGLLGIASFFVAAALEDGTYVALGFVLILAALLCAVFTAQLVRVQKIDDHYVYIKSVPAAYLALLTPLPRSNSVGTRPQPSNPPPTAR